jgi:hypothetical protein
MRVLGSIDKFLKKDYNGEFDKVFRVKRAITP